MWPMMIYGGAVFACMPAWVHVWLAGPGVYALCRRGLDGRVSVLHIGETANLGSIDRATWAAALKLGMTEVHVHALANAAARAALAARLRQRYPTPADPANAVHRALARLAGAFPPPPPQLSTLDWVEALMVAPPRMEGAAPALRGPPPAGSHDLMRRVLARRG